MITFTDSRFPSLTIKVRPSVTPHIRLDVRDLSYAESFRASLSLNPTDARAMAFELIKLADELES